LGRLGDTLKKFSAEPANNQGNGKPFRILDQSEGRPLKIRDANTSEEWFELRDEKARDSKPSDSEIKEFAEPKNNDSPSENTDMRCAKFLDHEIKE